MIRRDFVCGFALLTVLSTSALAQPGGSSQDELFGKLDRNGDGNISADEIGAGQRKSFERLLRVGDADKNGILTRAEFKAALKPLEPVAGNQRNSGARPNRRNRFNVKQFFRRFDRDGNGKLALSELPEQLRRRMKPVFDRLGKEELTAEEFTKARAAQNRRQPNPEQSFKRLDRNGDGKLSKSELPDGLQDRFRIVFARLKKDEITLKEYVKAVRRAADPAELFKRFDANGDGKLSIEEAPEGLRPRLKRLLERLGKESITQKEFARAFGRRPKGSGSQRKSRRPKSKKHAGTAGRPGRDKKRAAKKTSE